MIQFFVIPRNGRVPPEGKSSVFLRVDLWNDYSFVTMFAVTLFDENSNQYDLGSVKIGFQAQGEDTPTYSKMDESFTQLPDEFFSVGVDIDYYLKISRNMSAEFRAEYLTGLRDIAQDQKILDLALEERVFQTSHLRSLGMRLHAARSQACSNVSPFARNQLSSPSRSFLSDS